jgi:hypothetical protein
MNKEDKTFFQLVVTAGMIILAVLALWMAFSSCNVFKKVEQKKSDSTVVKKELETASKVDTSKHSRESAYTRETFIYPRDTNVFVTNNYPASPAVYIRETGTQKEVNNDYKFEDLRKEFLDSLSASAKSKNVETKVKVLDFWQLLALAGIAFLILKTVAGKYINFPIKKKPNEN